MALDSLRASLARATRMGPWIAFELLAMIVAFVWLVLRTHGDDARLRLCLLLAFPASAIGAVGLGMVLRIPAWIRADFDARALIRDGELMAYGALLGLVVAYAAIAQMRGFDPARALDRLAPSLGALVAIARVGCFVAGCDFGSPTHLPWGIRYAAGTAAFRAQLDAGLVTVGSGASMPVHPAQLYEAFVGVLAASVALAVDTARATSLSRSTARRLPAGATFVAAAATYALGRAFVDVFRGDDRGMLGPLSTPQWLSVAALVYLGVRVIEALLLASENAKEGA